MEIYMARGLLLAWERSLLQQAGEAEQREHLLFPASAPEYDPALLARAYTRCARITSRHSRTFFLASSLLPDGKRQAMRALYAFCRLSDDMVDRPGSGSENALACWRRTSLRMQPSCDPVAMAWADTQYRYKIPYRYVEQLLDGIARDLHQQRYATFAELTSYAYAVASTVGLMSMHIIGFANNLAIPYAIKLGIALQITNILRDVGEDWRAGRLYLPMEEMAAYGLSETDLKTGEVNDRWRAFLRFQIARNRRLYAEARPGIGLLHHDGRFAVSAASELYSAILDDIEAHDYDVFQRRAWVPTWRKAFKLTGIWLRNRQIVEKRAGNERL